MQKLYFFLIIAVVVTTNIVSAQPNAQKVVADRIIAQIGDKIILQSDITNALLDYKRQAQSSGGEIKLPPNAECAFLEGQLEQKALVLQAIKDSLPISDDELDALLDNQVRYFISAYGSQQALEEIAGKSIYQLKEDLRQPYKEKQLADQMRKKILENVKITPTEVKAYFDKIPTDSLFFYESEYELNQIVLYPKANKDIEEYVTNQLNDIKRQVESGSKKFEAMARIYSQDPAVKENGGQYNLNRNDHSFDPTFMQAAFKLKEGQISPVFKSKFGLHIIQMVSRAGDDAVVRHILIIPTVTDNEIKEAKAKLDSVRTAVLGGYMNFGEAVNKYTEDEQGKNISGSIIGRDGSSAIAIDQITDATLVASLKNLNVGDITKPIESIDERGRRSIKIVYLRSRTEPHRENLKDDYNKIAQRAIDQKKTGILLKWFKDHIDSYFVSIDKQFAGCSTLSEWFQAAADAAK